MLPNIKTSVALCLLMFFTITSCEKTYKRRRKSPFQNYATKRKLKNKFIKNPFEGMEVISRKIWPNIEVTARKIWKKIKEKKRTKEDDYYEEDLKLLIAVMNGNIQVVAK